ncbi:MAG: beta-lactamase family protein [Eubacterium sp.]|nr:beta-lactamase family protein [Eubacterium sp.]
MNIEKQFEQFLNEMKEKEIVLNYVQVRKQGKIILDWGRLSQKSRLNTWSVSKSFVSVAVGIAIDEGLISLDEKICDSFREYLPENPSENLTNLTVRHLLTMTTGVEHALFFDNHQERYETQDWISYFFSQNFCYQPGKRFLYCNFNTYMLACLIEKKAGMDIMEYLKPRLFTPLKIFSPDWTRCPKGHIHAANGLYLIIDDYGNFGQMLLNGGTFEGKRIVSEEYLKEATKNQMPEDWDLRYGYQFWIDEEQESFRADGKYGQYIIVLPKKEMVVSVQSLNEGRMYDEIRRFVGTLE